MSILTRPFLQINLDNLLENYRTLQKIAAPAVCAAVVKDDAYGLGAEKIVPLLYKKVNCRNFLWRTRLKEQKSPRWRRKQIFMFCRESVTTVWRNL